MQQKRLIPLYRDGLGENGARLIMDIERHLIMLRMYPSHKENNIPLRLLNTVEDILNLSSYRFYFVFQLKLKDSNYATVYRKFRLPP